MLHSLIRHKEYHIRSIIIVNLHFVGKNPKKYTVEYIFFSREMGAYTVPSFSGEIFLDFSWSGFCVKIRK